MKRLISQLLLLVVGSMPSMAQEAFDGPTLISPLGSNSSYLIDLDGTTLATWGGSCTPAAIAYLLEDGSVLRPCRDPGGSFQTGGSGGRIQWIDGDDNLIWDYLFSDSDHQQHHDIEPLPNGNVLLLAWELKTQAEAVAAGRQSSNGEIWPTLIVEVQPDGASGGNIVWEWHLWDHLVQEADPTASNYAVVADHPELLDINQGNVSNGDWVHANAIDYSSELDQIVFSSRTMSEIYVIDHSTTTAEASGHSGGNSGLGGDILYRWGNPQVYGRGNSGDQYFFGQHGVIWIDSGLPGEANLLVFNNGDRPGPNNDFSSVDEIVPPIDASNHYQIAAGEPFGPTATVWTYSDPGTFYADHIGGAYRLPNGNTLICEGTTGTIFEVTDNGSTVWTYVASGNVHRAPRYWDGYWEPNNLFADGFETGDTSAWTTISNPN